MTVSGVKHLRGVQRGLEDVQGRPAGGNGVGVVAEVGGVGHESVSHGGGGIDQVLRLGDAGRNQERERNLKANKRMWMIDIQRELLMDPGGSTSTTSKYYIHTHYRASTTESRKNSQVGNFHRRRCSNWNYSSSTLHQTLLL